MGTQHLQLFRQNTYHNENGKYPRNGPIKPASAHNEHKGQDKIERRGGNCEVAIHSEEIMSKV